jgi:hypothetical protein
MSPVWFTKHHPVHILFVKAMARIIGAERDLEEGVWTVTAGRPAVYQQDPSIIAQFVSSRASQPYYRSSPQAVLVSHRDALRNYIVGRKRKRGT